jgi:adenylate kinase
LRRIVRIRRSQEDIATGAAHVVEFLENHILVLETLTRIETESGTHHSTLSRTLLGLEKDGFVLTAAWTKLVRSRKLQNGEERKESAEYETI